MESEANALVKQANEDLELLEEPTEYRVVVTREGGLSVKVAVLSRARAASPCVGALRFLGLRPLTPIPTLATA